MNTNSFFRYTVCLIIAIAPLCIVCSQPAQKKLTYQNPIINHGLADPCVVHENGYFYLFATGKAFDGRGVQIYRSADLVAWTQLPGAVEAGKATDWNFKHFWAPEVIKVKEKFYLYYTASPEDSPENSGNRVGVAIADHIEGPYADHGVVIPHGSIDGHPFFDSDGQMYMYYTIENRNHDGLKAGLIYVDKMTSLTTAEKKPTLIFSNYVWQEGPFISHVGDNYIMTFSIGNWRDSTYHVRYAIAKSPLGPFIEQKNTILQTNEMVKGPGHHFLFKDNQGNDWIAYHGWDPKYTTRYPRIDPIVITSDTVYCAGPTFTPQEIIIPAK
jgi:beta-xylosidase